MSQYVNFERTIPYRAIGNGLLPAFFVSLIGPAGQEDALVILDTGAEYSVFNGSRAEALGLVLMEGRQQALSSLGGQLTGYIHQVELEIEGSRFLAEVVFTLNPIPRELLGRHSLFAQTAWGIRESRAEVYFSPHP